MKNLNRINRYLRLTIPCLVVLAICCWPSISAGDPPPPATVPDVASSSTTRVVDTTRINPFKARDIMVTVDNWREVLVRLDNIYTDPGVLQQRNAALRKFVSSMEDADHQPVWAQRDAVRKTAVNDLTASEGDLRSLAANGPPTGRDEAAVALLEVQSMAGEFKPAVAGALPLTERLPPGSLRDQVYYYLIMSSNGSMDAAGAQKYLAKLRELNRDAARRFFLPVGSMGILRSIVVEFESAQQYDDMAVMLAGNKLQGRFTTARDDMRKKAQEMYTRMQEDRSLD